MLSKYDEFPVHQSSRPFAHIPSTDYSWDEGYYFGVFNAEEKVYLITGMRINPNSDMLGGYAIIIVDGRQYSVRLSRCWRRQMDTVLGPLRYEFLEPLKTIRITLGKNDSALAFDIVWTGSAPAFEEDHHDAKVRGRATTDQTRYSQAGVASGFIEFDGKRYELTPEQWGAERDHSWGLYADRKPLGGHSEWLPPRPVADPASLRALRFMTMFRAGEWSGFYHIHENFRGEQKKLNDVFGSPFEGLISEGWDGRRVHFVAASHELRFKPGTRLFEGGTVHLTDDQGGRWTHHFEVVAPPYVIQTMGYTAGSWKDGGTMHTYHGSEELAIEWDDFDFSQQPFDYKPYPPRHGSGNTTDAEISNDWGLGSGTKTQGLEYLVKVELIAPDGSRHKGQGHVENFVHGRYDPYGFE